MQSVLNAIQVGFAESAADVHITRHERCPVSDCGKSTD
jgi:hypothetical protein